MSEGIKIGLALGSGASRGFAHIGILHVFEQYGIPIHMISGSSMGAVVGGMYAAGMPSRYLERIACNIDKGTERRYLDVDLLGRKGILRGDRIEKMIRTFVGNRRIEELQIPFVASACCLEDNQIRYFKKGNLSKAIRASFSIPGIFSPVEIEGKTYVDAGMLERVPVEILKLMGADFIIGVDVGYRGGPAEKPTGMLDLLYRYYDIVEWQAVQQKNMHEANCLIAVDTNGIRPEAMYQATECIERGRNAAEAIIDDLVIQLRALGVPIGHSEEDQPLNKIPAAVAADIPEG